MTKLLPLLVLLTFCCFFTGEGFAQVADTLKSKAAIMPKAGTTDQLGSKAAAGLHQLKQPFGAAAGQVNSRLEKGLDGFKKPPVSLDLVLGEGVRYNPVPVYPAVSNSRNFSNILSIQGNLTIYGVPINLNYSTDRASAYGGSNPYNDLFKFDFQPNQFSSLFKSDLQQYADLRRSAFDGRDLTGYTRKAISDELIARKGDATGPVENSLLASYLNDPQKLNGLLMLDREQIKEKLRDEITKKNTVTLNSPKSLTGTRAMLSTYLEGKMGEDIVLQQGTFLSLGGNSKLSTYFNDPANVSKLRLMNEDQITEKIMALSDSTRSSVKTGMPDTVSLESSRAGDSIKFATSRQLARQVMLSVRQDNSTGWARVLKENQSKLDARIDSLTPSGKKEFIAIRVKRRALNGAEKIQLNNNIEDVAQTITSIKERLASKGLDVKKILLMQKYMETGGVGFAPESANGFLSKGPNGAIQQFFSHLDALKLGAFSNQPSGTAQDRDLFMKGASITVKSGGIPLTFGYGSVNDISSSKDNQFQNSVYNQTRSITFIGAEMKRAGAGNLKISLVGGQNRSGGNNLYASPGLSANNIALTLSKKLTLGKLGDFGFDVSKSSTGYSNKYQVGAEAVLDQKGGLNYNLSNDLFQSLSFGADHHQDFDGIGASDNLYFSYSGMGYQNPAANGFGGARVKFGGNIRKSFDGNKLVMTVRSDITNMPISYTTSDRWKNHQFQLESRYQLSKKVNLSLKYITNGTGKQVDGVNTSVYSFQKIQFDGNASYKIGKYRSVSHFTIGNQAISNSFAPVSGISNSLPVNSAAAGNGFATNNGANLLIANYTQSVIIHQDVLTANVFVNRELGGYKLIGNLLNSDIAYQFMVFGKINMSSGLTYLDNTGIARQAGIRESISLMAGKRFNVETFVDIRKNMIRPLYPDLYANYRAQLSLFYRISH